MNSLFLYLSIIYTIKLWYSCFYIRLFYSFLIFFILLQIMVHRTNEINKKCLIPYIIKESKDRRSISGKLELNESMQVKDLYSLIEEQYELLPDTFTVHLNTGQGKMVSDVSYNDIYD